MVTRSNCVYAGRVSALGPESLDILDQILREKFPKVRSRVAERGLAALDSHVRRQLTDASAEELVRTGFAEDWAPNARGLAIEELIGLVCVNEDDS